MNRIFTLLILIFTMVIFSAGTTSLYAGQTAITKQEAKNTKTSKAYPYSNYKGIGNLELAKKEWIKDHPEEYKKLSRSTYVAPAKNDEYARKVAENQKKKLPANYNDSKTNNKSK